MAASSASSSRVSTFISLPWLTSPDNLQMRTTSGPTSGNEVVPRSLRPASLCPPASVVARAVCGGQYPVRAQRLRRVARGTFLIRAALFAARCRRRCRSGGRKPWRERPRCARPKWPRACPEGSLTPWLSLSLQVVGHSMFGGEKRRVFAASNALDCDSDLPDDPVPFVRKMLPATRSHSARACRPVAVLEMVARARRIRCRLAADREVITSGVTSTPSAITTTMLHLCSAPCKALRFAPPAHARGLRALTVPARR